MKKMILFISGLCLFTISAQAGGPGTTNANFLKAGQGVRPISMGETYSALGDGLDTLYWNPAGLMQLGSPAVSLEHSFWFQDIGKEYLAYGMPLGPLGAVAGGLTFLHAGSIDTTMEDASGNYAGTGGQTSAMNLALVAGYAQKLSAIFPIQEGFFSQMLVGAGLRIVNESIADTSIFGGGLDLGALWRQTEDITAYDGTTITRDKGLRFGFVARNLGATTDKSMPIDFRGGLGYILRDVFSSYGRATFAADLLVPIDNDIKVSLGAEYANISPKTEFAVRAGYKIGPEIKDLDAAAGFTAGAGFAIIAGLVKWQLDYAFVPYGELGTTHRVALTLGFLPGDNAVRQASRPWLPTAKPRTDEAQALPQAKPQPKTKPKPKPPEAAPAAASAPSAAPAAPAAPAEAAVAPIIEAPVSQADELKQALDRFQGRIKSGLLAGIEFKKGEASFLDKSQKTLDQLGSLLERYPETAVTFIGFDADKKIAEARGQAVAKYISMTYRVAPDRVSAKAGDMASQPKNSSIAFEVRDIAGR